MNSTKQKMLEAFKKEESTIDNIIPNLNIWKHSFQSILTFALYQVEYLDANPTADNPMDYLGRLADVYPIINEYSKQVPIMSTEESMEKLQGDPDLSEDINTLYAYAHYCQIMPQIHKKIFDVIQNGELNFSLIFKEEKFADAEIKDKILSATAQQLSLSFLDADKLKAYLKQKVERHQYQMEESDFDWIRSLFLHHIRLSQRIEVLPDPAIEAHLGFSNKEYDQFKATLTAFSDFQIQLGKLWMAASLTDTAYSRAYQDMYLRNSVCCEDYYIFDLMCLISNLSMTTFDKILSYYISIHQQPEHRQYESNSACKDGYFPPFVLTKTKVIFSPHALRYMHPFQNILYSVKEKNQRLFDDNISKYLEPTLINQTERLFNKFSSELKVKKNIHYAEGEIDLMVLSEIEKTCLVFQIKATVAPSSNRTITNVEKRTLEAAEQIERYEKMGEEKKLQHINQAFGTRLDTIKTINIILVRHCAGSVKAWNGNHQILNYSIMTGLLGKKLQNSDMTISNMKNDINGYMEELVVIAESRVKVQHFQIGELTIDFPDIIHNDLDVIARNLKYCAYMGDYKTAL
ncbi:hypothetical protein AQ505_08120 [Pedobacter sp. PACM 27299]|uniref:hypothetical protein n=1 Tax=Pedobacter sp. PACM 27299 TaxID=1727164 RepID=UPI000706A8DD|nr:hypothetical protein [Pedobacter sp. PACM 27299]ALL05460.1 hypothetical protein AQ505_08120 [Pedobacter sp. PACM 27299]